MIETSQWIKNYWSQNGKAPITTVKLYKIGKVLGKGAFGKVSLGIHKLTGKLIAIKSIKKSFMKDESSKNKVLKEVALWEQLSHPSIIRYLSLHQGVGCMKALSQKSICFMWRNCVQEATC